MVDVVGGAGIEVTHRIVGERGQVNDRVDPQQVAGLDLPDVPPDLGDERGRFVAEVAALVQVAVEADHVVAEAPQQGHRHCADVSAVTGDQDPRTPRRRIRHRRHPAME